MHISKGERIMSLSLRSLYSGVGGCFSAFRAARGGCRVGAGSGSSRSPTSPLPSTPDGSAGDAAVGRGGSEAQQRLVDGADLSRRRAGKGAAGPVQARGGTASPTSRSDCRDTPRHCFRGRCWWSWPGIAPDAVVATKMLWKAVGSIRGEYDRTKILALWTNDKARHHDPEQGGADPGRRQGHEDPYPLEAPGRHHQGPGSHSRGHAG